MEVPLDPTKTKSGGCVHGVSKGGGCQVFQMESAVHKYINPGHYGFSCWHQVLDEYFGNDQIGKQV